MKRFKEQLLGDVLDFYDHQRVPLSSLERDTRQGEFRYYGAQGVIDYLDSYIFDGQFILIAEDGANLVTRNEPIAFLVDGQFWVNNHAHVVRGRPGVADDFYITALLNNLNIAGFITGVAQPKLSQQNLKQIKISLPDYATQREIADVLSAYDELMENNRRRMELLEESARLLYREWFVRLRFPGHEHARLTHGIPQGWEKKRLDAIAEVNRATLPSSFDGEIEYVDIASVVPGQITETTTFAFQDAPSRARRIVQHGDIIWSCVRPNRRSHAVIWKPSDNLIVSTGFAVITPSGAPSTFIYFATTTDAFVGYLENHARGAAYPAVVAADFERAEILVPPKRLLQLFDEFSEPTFSQIQNLRQQNQKLRAARDLLLPRLMSGEMAV